MKVYRLTKQQYSNDLSGKGAEITGGRWNSKGTPIIYTSESRALCLAEIAVHLPVGIVPENYFLIEIEIPDQQQIYMADEQLLPAEWDSFPHTQQTQEIGDSFIRENRYLIMKVPSAVVKGDSNYLINPLHKDIGSIRILKVELFSFDKRLFHE